MFDRLLGGITPLSLAYVASELARSRPIQIVGSNPTAPNGYRSRQRSHFDARINRHTGKPHEHRREVARYARQAARSA